MTNDLSATSESSSPLIQRLERRHTEPVGLVNSLRFQPSVVNIPQAIVQRSALVQQLQTRYGNHSNEVAESELVLANPQASEVPSDTLSTVASSIAAIKKESKKQVVTERSQSEAESRGEDNQVRLKSQFIENFPNLNSTQSTDQSTSSVTPPSGGQFRVSRKAIPKISQMDANTTIQAKYDTSKAVNSSISATDKMPLANAVTTQLPSSQVSSTKQSALLQMKSLSSDGLIQRSVPFLLGKSPTNTSIPNTSSHAGAVNVGLTSTSSLPVVSELPFSSSLLQRASDEDVVDLGYIDFPRFDNSPRNIDSLLPFRQNAQRMNLSQEKVSIGNPEANYAPTNPRTENTPAALALNTGSVYESFSEGRSFSTLVPSPVILAKEPQTSLPEIDVAQVAEQVSRILFRQLRTERERRGFSR